MQQTFWLWTTLVWSYFKISLCMTKMWAAQNFLAKGDNSKWRKVELLFMCMRHLPTMNNNCIKLFWNPSMHNKDMGQTRFFDKGRRLKNQESQGYSSCTWHTFWLWATILWSYFKIHLWLNKIRTGQEKDMGRTQFFLTKGDNSKTKKGRVIVHVHDTPLDYEQQLCEVILKSLHT